MIKLNGIEITPTLFPDKTSQVWRLPEKLLEGESYNVEWYFSHEAELIHLCQLADLLIIGSEGNQTATLYIDYLPYGRQDKDVSNDSTFALYTFTALLNYIGFDEVIIQDPHSYKALELIDRSIAVYPEDKINNIIEELQINTICYPDKGADVKYSQVYDFPNCDIIVGEKIRNQSTGLITDYKILDNNVNIENKNILIVDDICDGGATFIILAEHLLKHNVKLVNLFVSHGLFTKGLKPLFKSGINRIFTPKGEAVNIHNTWGFKNSINEKGNTVNI